MKVSLSFMQMEKGEVRKYTRLTLVINKIYAEKMQLTCVRHSII